MTIKEAKKIKQDLIEYIENNFPNRNAKVELFFQGNTLDSLALRVTFEKFTIKSWGSTYHGLPLVVVQPANQKASKE